MSRAEERIRQEAVLAIADLNSPANTAVMERTRRLVRDKARALAERRRRQRNHACIAAAASLAALVILAPAVWNSLEEFMGGGHLMDLPMQTSLVFLVLTPALLAALIAIWKEHRDMGQRKHDS